MGLSLVAPLLFLAFALGALVGSRGRSVRAALCTAIANGRITGGAPHAAGKDAAEGAVDADLVATASAEQVRVLAAMQEMPGASCARSVCRHPPATAT